MKNIGYLGIFLIITLISSAQNFEKCYVTYKTKGFNDKEKFIVYIQNKIYPLYYYGFEISHELDTSLQSYTNQFRLQKALIYEFDGEIMYPIGLTALAIGESECVYKAINAIDFTGGFHGDEQLYEVNFFIDDVRLSKKELSKNFYLKPCTEFSYVQKSNMHKTFRRSALQNRNKIEQVEAIHFKHSIFKNSGYETHNRLEWLDSLSVETGYMSISSISIDMGEFCQSDKYQIYRLNRKSDRKLQEVNDNIHIWNETNKTYAKIRSEFNLHNDLAIQFIWDVPNYNKYYRNLVLDIPILVSKGDVWKSSTYIEFGIKHKK